MTCFGPPVILHKNTTPLYAPNRMKSGQKSIYYMASDSLEVARSAPFVEKLIKKGLEVCQPHLPYRFVT